MNNVSEINEKEHYLMAQNGYTRSNGVGMADSGGYATVYTHILTKDEALHEKAKDDSVRVFKIKEIVLENVNEYREYLKLKEKYRRYYERDNY